MSITEILSLLTFCGTVTIGLITLGASISKAKMSSDGTSKSVARLEQGLESVRLDIKEHSVKLSHVGHTMEKYDSRLTRLENHSFNL